ncbi:uncharacterized protein isoform X2 [Leptinotarsa decemlineata]|uniref:uncharacterized protein isoform X2 n=1 Tax=Leptinotarsa decemlineata TaxID=7539 RepID=UPI003D304194
MSCHSKVCIMNTRSRRLIALAKINNEIEVDTWTENNLIFLPKHESTQGTTREQQIAAIQGFELVNSYYSEAKTSGSEYIPDSDDNSSSDKEKLNKNERFASNLPAKNIKILQDVTIRMENEHILTNYVIDDNKTDKSYVMRKYFETKENELMNPLNLDEGIDVPDCSHTDDKNTTDTKRKVTNETSKISNSSSENVYRKSNILNEVKINPAGKNNGKRIRNKTHVCYFCEKILINMARHFELVHSKETEVSKYLIYPKKSKERRDGFKEIIRVGDFYHNCNVLATNKGELILIRRPTENEINFIEVKDYGPCPNCLGFLLKKHIWHHLKFICKEKLPLVDSNSKHVIAESNAIMADIYGFGFTKDFTDAILSTFKSDDVGSICQSDILIMKFGAMQFEKFGKTQK